MLTARQDCAREDEKGNGLRRFSLFSLPIIKRVTSRSMLSARAIASSRSIGVPVKVNERDADSKVVVCVVVLGWVFGAVASLAPG